MKQVFFSIGHNMLCLATFAVVGWSCTKTDYSQEYDWRTENVIVQARSYYESIAAPLTKISGGQPIAIKPLPGEMTPLWDRAAATVWSDGTAWVDVPIESAIIYTAVRQGHHSHDGEACGHDRSAVRTLQKLVVQMQTDGSQRALVATIVPEAGCVAELRDFSSAIGLAGFDGFVSWHDLTGRLVQVARYENGTCTQSAEPTGENEAKILEIVDEAILYPEHSILLLSIKTKVYADDICTICRKDCKAKNDRSKHCIMCDKYNDYAMPFESQCVCARCGTCGKRFEGKYRLQETCTCGGTIEKVGCEICKTLLCFHLLGGEDRGEGEIYSDKTVPTVHELMLQEIFEYDLSVGEYKYLRAGSHTVDNEYQNFGDEYIHGMYYYMDSRSEALTKMRSFFVYKIRGFVQSGDMLALGEGLHPVLDTYVEMQTREDMLNGYSYATLYNIVQGMNTPPYTGNPEPCTEAVHDIFDALIALPSTATDSQIGAIFDHWVSKAGSGKPDLLD